MPHTRGVEEDDPGERRRVDEQEFTADHVPAIESALEPGDFPRRKRARRRIGRDLCPPGAQPKYAPGDKDALKAAADAAGRPAGSKVRRAAHRSAGGATRCCPWLGVAPVGSAGVTPLNVAALLPTSAAMRQALAGMAPSVDKLWGLVQAQDGTTPESLCDALAAAAAAAPEASAASTASASSSAGTSSAAMEQQPSGSKPAAELEALVEGERCWPPCCAKDAGLRRLLLCGGVPITSPQPALLADLLGSTTRLAPASTAASPLPCPDRKSVV